MKLFLPILLLASASACATGEARPAREPRGEVRCELVGLGPVEDAAAQEPWWSARFRVVNGTSAPIEYRGWTPAGPLYEEEVLGEGGDWQCCPHGWCGTGLSRQALAPGAAIEVAFALPADGKTHRFRFGDPAIVTDGVSAPR